MDYIDIEVLVECMQDAFALGKTFSFTPFGDSMLPTFKNGEDTVTLAPCKKPKIGDVVFYKRPSGKYTLHRIVGKLRGGYMLCGDNENIIEYPVYPEAMLAKIVDAKDANGNPKPFSKRKSQYKNLWIKKLKLYAKKILCS